VYGLEAVVVFLWSCPVVVRAVLAVPNLEIPAILEVSGPDRIRALILAPADLLREEQAGLTSAVQV
jgi:hypothetical protein